MVAPRSSGSTSPRPTPSSWPPSSRSSRRDVVFVATNDLARMNRVISQILPLVNTIWQTWSMIYTTKTQIGF